MRDTIFLDIREATPADASQIHEIMRLVQTEMEDESMYIIGSEKKIEHFLETDDDYGYVAEHDGEIISFALFAMGRKADSEKPRHASDGSNDSTRALRCVSFATKPSFRLAGIASHLITTGLSRGRLFGCQFVWTTIDPRNGNALRVMMRHGMEVQATAGQLTRVDDRYMSYESDEPAAGMTDRRAITRSILYGPLPH